MVATGTSYVPGGASDARGTFVRGEGGEKASAGRFGLDRGRDSLRVDQRGADRRVQTLGFGASDGVLVIVHHDDADLGRMMMALDLPM